MADTDLNVASLTVVITEALAIGHDVAADERDFAQINTMTFANIINTSKRVLKLGNTNLTTVVGFGSVEGAGVFKRTDVKYIRITNLDGTASLQVGLDDGAVGAGGSDAGYMSVGPACSAIFTGTTIEGTSLGTTLDAAVTLNVLGIADQQVEIFVATI
tara:strand:- start:1070 stop:1546 length:477 start_codon:yes stop_codon:yes gene_type:complete